MEAAVESWEPHTSWSCAPPAAAEVRAAPGERASPDASASDAEDASDASDAASEGGESEAEARREAFHRCMTNTQLVLLGVFLGIACTQFGLVDARALLRSLAPSPPPHGECARSPFTAAPFTAAPLPHGWSEHRDPTSGKLYYFDAASQTSTWERPLAAQTTFYDFADEPDAEDEYDDAPDAGDDEYDELEDEGELPPGWVRYVHQPSGRPYYGKVGSQETTWVRPGVELQEPWEEHWDVTTKRFFYHNPMTGESTWERP
ncbi:hypothetical protein AB1Y20_011303 [Prymnesium parvum]|uniref:WW domain-containing protein n=1 Tax=Prymnesium parvum TaxID=97485 RepID=A0AB34IM77_PRYPA